MQIRLKNIILALSLVATIVLGFGFNFNVPEIQAQTEVTIPPIDNGFGDRDLAQVVLSSIKILFLLIVIAAVVVIIVAGFRMVTGGSNPETLKKAKSTIIWAVIGLAVAFMAFSIVTIIQRIFQK